MVTVWITEPKIRAVASKATTDHTRAGIRRTAEAYPAKPALYDAVDQAAIDSFPASDPPAWTCGVDTADGRPRNDRPIGSPNNVAKGLAQ